VLYTGHILKHTLIGKKNSTHYFLLLNYSDNLKTYLALLISSKPSEFYIEVDDDDIFVLTHKSYIQMENMHTIKHNAIKQSHVVTKVSPVLYRKTVNYWKLYIQSI